MKFAEDFRYIAREALRGKWGIAVITGLIASLLGGLGSDGPEVKLNIDMSEGANVSFEYAGQTILSTSGGMNEQLGAILIGSAIYIAIAAILLAVVYFAGKCDRDRVCQIQFESGRSDGSENRIFIHLFL